MALNGMEVSRMDHDASGSMPAITFNRTFSRESSILRNPKNIIKTRTIDGAKVIQNGKVYRQIFEAEVQLHQAVKDVRYERENRPQVKMARSNRNLCLPVVNNLTTIRGMLAQNGVTWTGVLPNEARVENPVYIKQMRELNILERAHSEDNLFAREVHDLPDFIRPAKLSSNIIDRIIEYRREKHNKAIEDMHQELSQINKNIEPKISNVCDDLVEKLADSDSQIDDIIQPLRNDETMKSLKFVDINFIWSEVTKQSKYRQELILNLDCTLSDLEDERVLWLRTVMTNYSELLERSSHLAPADLHRMIDAEVMEMNQNLLSNRRAYADLVTRLMMADIDREHRQHCAWQGRVDDWKSLNTEGGSMAFQDFMRSPEIVDPPGVTNILARMKEEQSHLNQKRISLLFDLKGELKPPNFTKHRVYEWNEKMISLSKNIDQLNQTYLKEIYGHYEQVTQRCLKEMERCRVDMIESGVCNEEEAQEVLERQFIPLIGERQRIFEASLEKFDKTFEGAAGRVSKQLKSLFKFCQGVAQLWDRHELGLAGQERKLAERLETSRAVHDTQNQEREAALDMAMDRMRQEATEAALKDCLKKSLDMLEKIKQSFLQFHNQQLHIVKGYPGMVDSEVDVFDEALCQYFGLKKKEKSNVKEKSGSSKESSPSKSSKDSVQRDATFTTEASPATEVSPRKSPSKATIKDKVVEMIVTTNGNEFMVLAVAGKHGPDPLTEKKAGKKGGATPGRTEDDELPANTGYILPETEVGDERGGEEDSVPEIVQMVMMDSDVIMSIKKDIRQLFLDFLGGWKCETQESAKTVVAAKTDELESELKLRLHLHEPRGRRAQLDVHNVRAAELVLHSERVVRHCKGIGQTLGELRVQFTTLDEEHERAQESFKAELAAMDEVFNTATKSTKLSNMTSKLGVQVNKFMNHIRVTLRKFRQTVDDQTQMLREANARFIKSFKLFSESGNFCPEEVDDYHKRLEKMGLKIDETEASILSELEGIEKKRQDYVTSYVKAFEDRFKHQLVDLVFIEKIARWLTNTQVKIKAEVANCNSQAQKLADLIQNLDRRIDACQRPNLDKTPVTPDQVNESLLEIFQACHDRSIYLNSVQTQVRPKTPPQADSVQTGPKVMFTEPTPISKTGKAGGDDPSIAVIREILKSQRDRTSTIEVAAEDGEDAKTKGSKSCMQSFADGTSALGSLADGTGQGSKKASRRGSNTTAGGPEDGGKRRQSPGGARAANQLVSKNQRLDKKYLVFGEEPDENEETHFNGKVRVMCRMSLEGMLYISEMYYRTKGSRAVTRPQSLQENFDLCADAIIQKLQSYSEQAAQYHNTCVLEFRDHLIKLEKLSEQVPNLMIGNIFKVVMEELQNNMQDVDRAIYQRMEQLEKDKERYQSQLRPTTGHPNKAEEMESLCDSENQRHSTSELINKEHREGLRQMVLNAGRSFSGQVSSISEQLLLQFDNLLTVDDVERAKIEMSKHRTSELIRRQRRGDPLEEDINRTLIERGKNTWSGLVMTEFMSLENEKEASCVEPPLPPVTETKTRSTGKKTPDVKTAPASAKTTASKEVSFSKTPSSAKSDRVPTVITAKITMAHNATISARDKYVQEFRKNFYSILQDIEEKIYKQEVTELRWFENWQKSITTIKNLY